MTLTENENNLNIIRSVDTLFKNPYVRSMYLRETLKLSIPTANSVLGELECRRVIREVSGRQRNRVFVADGILEILRG